MLTRHFSHLIFEPKQSLQDADRQPANLFDIMIHIALLALIPAVCTYVASAYIGWDLGVTDRFFVSPDKALNISLATFILLNAGVYGMGYGICWLAKTFDITPSPVHCLELAVFASLPLFLSGFIALYPVLYVDVAVGILAVAASVYLLYVGVPIFMHIPEDEGFMYSTWVVTIGLVAIVTLLAASVFFMDLMGAI